MSKILVVGSLGYDSISTPEGHVDNILGGSANYFSLVASMFSGVNIVGVVGEDYKSEDYDLLTSRNIDVEGLQKVPGKTFHWEGKYEKDMNEAITLTTELNVFENFNPQIPEKYKSSEYLFLANIDPVLQMQVLDQVEKPKVVGVDTMNFWISSKKQELIDVFKRSDILLLNEGEARDLTGKWNGVEAAKELAALGPKAVVVKRGEYGFLLFTDNQYFIMPAFPIEKVVDPTGAGDTFAGGFFGYLAKTNSDLSLSSLKQACVYGCLMASYTVQDFSVNQLKGLTWTDVEKRLSDYKQITSF